MMSSASLRPLCDRAALLWAALLWAGPAADSSWQPWLAAPTSAGSGEATQPRQVRGLQLQPPVDAPHCSCKLTRRHKTSADFRELVVRWFQWGAFCPVRCPTPHPPQPHTQGPASLPL